MSAESDLERHASVLADAVEAALPRWVERSVTGCLVASGTPATAAVAAAVAAAGHQAVADVGGKLRALLAQDVDEQRTNPLALLRRAVAYPTEVLRAAGVPPATRAEFEQRAFPDDAYGLAPATWADIDPSLHEVGLQWGAAKAFVVLRRRRDEGAR